MNHIFSLLSIFAIIGLITFIIGLWLTPVFVSMYKHVEHKYKGRDVLVVIGLTLCFSWTIIGWLLALAISMRGLDSIRDDIVRIYHGTKNSIKGRVSEWSIPKGRI